MSNKLIRSDRRYEVNPSYTLSAEQVDGVEFILQTLNCMLVFQTGIGKSILSLTACEVIRQSFPDIHFAIVCPPKAVRAFEDELKNRIHASYELYISGGDVTDRQAHYHIFTTSMIQKFKQYMDSTVDKHMLIVDELHTFKSTKTTYYPVLKQYRHRFTNCVGLTATPLENHVDMLYNLVELVKPGYLGTYTAFARNFIVYRDQWIKRNGVAEKIKVPSSLKNTSQLKELLTPIALERSIHYDLDFDFREVELSQAELDRYFDAADGIINDPDDERVFSARLHDLQRVVDGPLVDSQSVSTKEKAACRIIREITARNEAVLVYTEYEDTYERLVEILEQNKSKLGINSVYLISGKVSQKRRKEIVDLIQPCDVVVVTKAGSESINLQKANNVLFYDLPFSIGTYIQMCGRITRVTSEYDKFHIIILEATGTIDTYRKLRLERHRKVISKIFQSSEALPKIEDSPASLQDLKATLLWKSKVKDRRT